MSNKARRLLVLLLIILKEAGPTAACSSSCSSWCNCRSRGLTSVPQDLRTDIPWLDLLGNAITTLSQSDFSRYRDLTRLDLGSNQISMIQNKTFYNLTSLRYLDLRYNQLRSLQADIFVGLGNLQTLYLSSNQLTTLPADIIVGLGKLKTLWLNSNQFTTLPADIFVGLRNLQNLYLNSNQFPTLPADIFVGLGNLQILDLSSNQFTTLPADIFVGLGNLQILLLSSNQLTTLPADIFVGLGNLETLYLNNNDIRSIEAGTFNDTTRLRYLNIANNNIRTIPADTFGNLLQLEQLGLGDNNISTFPLEALANLNIAVLSALRLNNNQMETLPVLAYDILASVPAKESYILGSFGPSVRIDNNPWQCDCRMLPFRQRMSGSYPFEDQIRCAGPANLAGQLLRDVGPENLICEEMTPAYSTSNTKHVVDSTFRLSTVSNSPIHQSTQSTPNFVLTLPPTPSSAPTAGSNPDRSTVSTAPLFKPSAKLTTELPASSQTNHTVPTANSNPGLSTVSTDSSFTFQSTMTESNAGPTGSGIVLPVPVLALLCILPGLLIIAFGIWCMFKRRKRDHTAVPDPSAGSSNANPTFYGHQQIRKPADINSQSEMTHGPGRDDSQHIYNVPNDDPDTAEYDTIADINQPESPHQENMQGLDSVGYLVLPPPLPPENQTGPQANGGTIGNHSTQMDEAEYDDVISPSQRPLQGSGQMQHLGNFNDGYEIPSPSQGPENGSHSQAKESAKESPTNM
ncbi:uncharacterized protein LOC144861572 [Branchiostoma floridae x Branchiostoma japonicum]